jgi:hypothetical protein
MALNTGRELLNAGLNMHGPSLVWIMGMAVGASVLVILPRVTALAIVFGNLAMV